MGKYTDKLAKRISTRGPKQGYCVICGKWGNLSRDHVPPKGCNNLSDAEIRFLHPPQDTAHQRVTSQGGVTFRTLCGDCNSGRLGAEYDPALINLSNEITQLSLSARGRSIALPQTIPCLIRPQRIARAIVGHVIAVLSVNEVSEGLKSNPIIDVMREYFLEPNAALPVGLAIYFWVYPHRRQVIIKNMAKMVQNKDGQNVFVTGHIIKFLPLGFWLTFNSPSVDSPLIHSLVEDNAMGLDDVTLVNLDIYSLLHPDFPEAPVGNQMMMYDSNYGAEANPKARIKGSVSN